MANFEDFLPYELLYLTPEMTKTAEKELNETDETKKKSLEDLRELLKGEEGLYVRTDDAFLLGFLRKRKFNAEQAFKSIQKYYQFKKENDHFYMSESNEQVHEVFRKNFIGFLQRRDKDGRVVLVFKLGCWDPEEVTKDLLMWTITHCMTHSIEDPATQVLGYTLILDLNGCGQKHIKQCTPENIKLMLHATQSCFPGRYKEIHVIGVPKIFAVGYSVIYPVLPNKIKRRVFIHGDNMKSLHQKIPTCILPSEYGGELGPFSNKEWHDLILTRNDWCLASRHYGYK